MRSTSRGCKTLLIETATIELRGPTIPVILGNLRQDFRPVVRLSIIRLMKMILILNSSYRTSTQDRRFSSGNWSVLREKPSSCH